DAKDGRHVHCFGCGTTWDIFDLIALNELKSPVIDGPDGKPKIEYSFSEAYNKALQVLNVNARPMAQSEHKRSENERERNLREQINEVNSRTIQGASQLLDAQTFSQIKNPSSEQQSSHEQGLNYLKKRGISPETAKRFNVGFSSNWSSPTAILKGHNPQGTPRLIIPTVPFSYIARDSRDNILGDEQPYKKMKEGPVHIFNESALNKNQPIFIIEGEIDAMSVMETGKAEAIGLGSVANINIFMKALYKAKKARKDDFYPTLLIALDNDDAGKRAINMLTTQLNHAGVWCVRLLLNGIISVRIILFNDLLSIL
ncbi:helicase DnaB, partial [Lactobacillus reuteri]